MRMAYAAIVLGGLCIGTLPAHAALVVSTAASANVKCKQGQYALVCTATSNNAVLNVKQLEHLLASQNLNVATGSATNDIVINAPLSWTSASGLAFIAQRSIVVNAHVSDAGTGTELNLEMGSGGQLSFGPQGNVGFLDTSSLLVIDNQGYQLVKSVASLATWVGNNPAGHFALAANYDATPDGIYAQAPIQPSLTGIFEGLGNTISNLSINDQIAGDNVGLFAEVQNGTVENVRLAKANVQATGNASSLSVVGGLVGYNQGTLYGDSVTGKVIGHYAHAGGLTGGQFFGTITDCYSTAIVKGAVAGDIGGLAGFQTNGTSIRNSHATGTVSGGDGMPVGGLVGSSFTTIQGSYATGAVSGGTGAYVGGLAGIADGTIRRSYATGNASAGDNSEVGGLVGRQFANVSLAFATGQASAQQGASAGGLAGTNSGGVVNTYATGIVTSTYSGNLGGLVGFNDGTISSSYSTGQIDGDLGGVNGGFIGDDNASSGSLTHDYWDTDTSGITNASQGAGTPANDPGIKPKTSGQLKSNLPLGFNSSIWGEQSTVNNGLPYLLAVPPG